jgi:ABC-2 type transport system permease protein
VVLGAGLIIWALPNLNVIWSFETIGLLAGGLVSAALVTASSITVISAFALILGRARFLFGLYFDFWELSRYPASIFAPALQLVLLTVIPLGYMAFVPISVLLGRPVPYLGSAAPLAALVAGPISVFVAVLFWRFCLRRYQGGGG